MALTKVSSSLIQESTFNVLDYGAKGDGVTNDGVAIQACLDAAAVNGGRVVFPNTGNDYLTEKFLLVSGKITIEFLGSDSYLKIVADDGGGVISALANADVTFINPRIDGGASALDGQNGIGAGKNARVTVLGGHIRNCTAYDFDYTGGKALNIDGWDGTKFSVSGTRISDCSVAISHKRDVAYVGEQSSFIASGVTIDNCTVALHCYGSNTLDEDKMVTSLTGITIRNCGTTAFSGAWTGGIIVGSAARNAKIEASIVNEASYNGGSPVLCIVRGRWQNSSFDLTVNADCTNVVDYDTSPGIYWAENSGINSESNTYKVNVQSDYQRLVWTDTGAIETIPYSSYGEFVAEKQPGTAYIAPKIGEGTMAFKIVNDGKYVSCSGSVLAASFNTYATMPSLSNPPVISSGTWQPSYAGTTGSAGTLAYTERTGRWTKIGTRVFINGVIILSDKGSWTGSVVIGNLPFNAAGSSGYESYGSIELRDVTFTEKYAVFEISRTSVNSCRVRLIDSAATSVPLPTTGVANNSGFLFSLSYEAA